MTITRILTAIRQPSDTKTLSESVEGTFIPGSQLFTIEISDSIDLFENIYSAIIYTVIVPTDTITVSESVQRAESLVRQELDVTELIDNISTTTRPTILILLNETLPVSEILNESELLIRRAEEDTEISGSQPLPETFIRNASDTKTLSEAIERKLTHSRIKTDIVTNSDSVVVVLDQVLRILVPEITLSTEQHSRKLKLLRQMEELE